MAVTVLLVFTTWVKVGENLLITALQWAECLGYRCHDAGPWLSCQILSKVPSIRSISAKRPESFYGMAQAAWNHKWALSVSPSNGEQ